MASHVCRSLSRYYYLLLVPYRRTRPTTVTATTNIETSDTTSSTIATSSVAATTGDDNAINYQRYPCCYHRCYTNNSIMDGSIAIIAAIYYDIPGDHVCYEEETEDRTREPFPPHLPAIHTTRSQAPHPPSFVHARIACLPPHRSLHEHPTPR